MNIVMTCTTKRSSSRIVRMRSGYFGIQFFLPFYRYDMVGLINSERWRIVFTCPFTGEFLGI